MRGLWTVPAGLWHPLPCLQAEEAAKAGGVQAQICGRGAGGGAFRCNRCLARGEHRGGSCRHFRQCGGIYDQPVVDTGMHSSSDSDNWMNPPRVGMGGGDRNDSESVISSPGSLTLGQVSSKESKSDSDSSFVGESLAEAAEMAANRTGRGEDRRYHTRQVTREAQWQQAAAAAVDDGENCYGSEEGDRHEKERGGGLSEGYMDVEHLFGSSSESDDGAEGVDSESLSLSLSFTTLGITDSTDSTYLQSQSSKINKGGAGGDRCGIG